MSTNSPTSAKKIEALLRRFRRLYGEGGVSVLRAPARINILGEHVDYVSYLPTASLPFGSHEHGMWMAFRANDVGEVRGASTNDRFAPFGFALTEIETAVGGGRSWEEVVFNRPIPAPHWSNYVRGAVGFAHWKHGATVRRGIDFLIDSTIPPAGGASSSSALVVLAGAGLRLANQIEFEPAELARDSSQAEWFLGTRGGALDHTAICLAKRNQAVHLSYADNRAELVPLPVGEFRWMTFFSHPADKGRDVMLEYNERAAVSRLLIPAALETAGTVEALPEAMTLADVERRYPAAFADCQRAFPALVAERFSYPLKLRDRAMHHAGEVRRVAEAVTLLRGVREESQADAAMPAMGTLLNESHESLCKLYEVCTPQVRRLVEVIRADAQVYGARLMGGGFGGNVLALTTAGNVESLIDHVQREFYGPQDRDGVNESAVMVSTPGDGLSVIEP
jgi:galactokinase